ncbi:hypothetical protein [Oceanobacillus profundus]|uniref:Nucleotide pyrophosphohydrolase n=1 Tax=Oceanobacillus profundus TaxID=372463 RepID=A0A417YGL5_9BACI|nr:hypothetical protein [Oceanobacillus profundus]MBR2246124.1 hypothetical protein [Bacilli bacterium]MBR3119794.1 hypothetical protein [Oceanobacillus sp.]RHW31943.1 hypothetical protein D1B32_11940 [Oceanobacillus profundus]
MQIENIQQALIALNDHFDGPLSETSDSKRFKLASGQILKITSDLGKLSTKLLKRNTADLGPELSSLLTSVIMAACYLDINLEGSLHTYFEALDKEIIDNTGLSLTDILEP